MRKILLSFLALALSSVAAMAQTLRHLPTVTVKPAMAKEIADNQKYVFVPGADDPVSGWGMPKNAGKVTRMGCVIPSQYTEAYAGAKVIGMRFLTQSAQTVTPHLMEVGKEIKEVASGTEMLTAVSTLNEEHTAFDEHWNDAMFAKPYVLPSTPVDLMVAFDYTQASTQDAEGYCFLMGKTTDKKAVIKAFGDFGNGEEWKDVRTGNTLSVELLVEKEGGSFADDISIVSVIADPTVMVENMVLFPFQFIARNSSDGECDDCLFAIMFDGEEVGYCETVAGYGIGKQGAIMSTGFYPSRHKHNDGVHTLGIKVKKVNGKDPVGNTADDEYLTELRIYTDELPRQNSLVEHFTSSSLQGCTVGYDAMRTLQKQRSDVAWVSIHGTADEQQPDPMAVDKVSPIFYYSANAYPAFNVNRSKLDNVQTAMTTVLGSAKLTADSIANAIDAFDEKVPAFVKLGMSANLEISAADVIPNSRLTITVTGEGVENASKILDTAVLGLYITQKEVIGKQNTANGWVDDYSHNYVLRAVATDNPSGDPIVWDGDRFEKTYSLELDHTETTQIGQDSGLQAVAFVSLPFMVDKDGEKKWNMDTNNAWVNQCLTLNLKNGETTGIETVGNEPTAVVARYAADGTRLAAPQKGINILKMADGTTRKVFVGK